MKEKVLSGLSDTFTVPVCHAFSVRTDFFFLFFLLNVYVDVEGRASDEPSALLLSSDVQSAVCL